MSSTASWAAAVDGSVIASQNRLMTSLETCIFRDPPPHYRFAAALSLYIVPNRSKCFWHISREDLLKRRLSVGARKVAETLGLLC